MGTSRQCNLLIFHKHMKLNKKTIIAKTMEKLAGERPPKGWWNDTHESVARKNKGLSSKSVDRIVGDLWHNKMDNSSRSDAKEEFKD